MPFNTMYNNKVVLGDGTVLIDLTADTVTHDKILKSYTAHDKSGAPIVGSCDFDVNSQDATAAVAEVLNTKTFYARGTKLTGTMPNVGKQTGTISTLNGSVTIRQGYHDGSGVISLDAGEKSKLIAENIREGVTIFGVAGTMSGSEDESPEANRDVTPTFAVQTITPGEGYTCLRQVTVAAIPVVYSDNSAGGQTVTIG